MTDKKVRSKHVGYTAQREQCRLNKYTYTENVGGCVVLFCNYPFNDPYHKKGICRANTCTDMREIPADVVAADDRVEVPERKVPTCDELDATTMSDSGESDMPCPNNG